MHSIFRNIYAYDFTPSDKETFDIVVQRTNDKADSNNNDKYWKIFKLETSEFYGERELDDYSICKIHYKRNNNNSNDSYYYFRIKAEFPLSQTSFT